MTKKQPAASPRQTEPGVSQWSTRSLVRRMRLGERLAVDHLFARLTRHIRRWTHGRLPNRTRHLTDTGDVAQEVAIKAWRNLHRVRLERPGDLEAYIRQAVGNRLRDEARRAQRTPEMTGVDSTVPAAATSPLQAAMSSENWQHYQAALAALPGEERTAIVARVEDGYSYQQLARLLGKSSPDAARMAVNRAVHRLTRLLGENARTPPS